MSPQEEKKNQDLPGDTPHFQFTSKPKAVVKEQLSEKVPDFNFSLPS